jgi:hypothetical protein
MGFKSFALIKQAYLLFMANRRAILSVAVFPLCVLFVHDLARLGSTSLSLVFELPLAFLLVPFKIDLMRLALLGETPAGGHAGRFFRPREMRYFLYEAGLTLIFVGLGLLVMLITRQAEATWDGMGPLLRLGSVGAVGVLLFAAFYYCVPATLFFPGLSIDRKPPLKTMFAEAAPHRWKVFFLVFWIFAAFAPLAAMLPTPGAAATGVDPVAVAISAVNAILTLAANVATGLAVGLLFRETILRGNEENREKNPF